MFQLVRALCPLCECKTDFDTKLTARDYLFSQEEFSVVQCNQCGLLYTDPCVSEDDIGFYYFPEYGPYKEAGRSKGLVEKLRLFLRQGPDKHFQEILYLLKTNQARRCIKGKDG